MSSSYLGGRVGLYLRQARKNKGLTIDQVATDADFTTSALSMLEKGVRNERINLDKLRVLALMVGYPSLSKLIADAENNLTDEQVIARGEKLRKSVLERESKLRRKASRR